MGFRLCRGFTAVISTPVRIFITHSALKRGSDSAIRDRQHFTNLRGPQRVEWVCHRKLDCESGRFSSTLQEKPHEEMFARGQRR